MKLVSVAVKMFLFTFGVFRWLYQFAVVIPIFRPVPAVSAVLVGGPTAFQFIFSDVLGVEKGAPARDASFSGRFQHDRHFTQGSRFPVPDAVGRVRDAMLFMPVRHMERAEEGLQDRREKRGLG
ncbi:hypothetical protein H0G86_002724 [Trichoderma simmonsii]|uniref:Uncharacterized protein n=1 Tax=Trichoderma simmonsii TaxID=1491479 RepID=A0A8G0PG94_9HYPO|nr:hypothetical protein H0G86_002724 [Trichoderma simmonsii]